MNGFVFVVKIDRFKSGTKELIDSQYVSVHKDEEEAYKEAHELYQDLYNKHVLLNPMIFGTIDANDSNRSFMRISYYDFEFYHERIDWIVSVTLVPFAG